MRMNDLGGAMDQSVRDRIGPGVMGFLVVISRVIYRSGRRKWRVTLAEATIVSLATGSMGPVFHMLGMPADLCYPAAVWIGFIGIDRASIAICKRLGIEP